MPVTAPHSFNKPDRASSGQLSQTQSWREADDPKLFSQTARDQMFALRLSFETKQTGSSGFAQSDESMVISDHTRSVIGGFFNRL